MATASKRKTSLTLDAAMLDSAKELGINVSAVADAALQLAIAKARQSKWLDENAEAFVLQAAWHESHDHPLTEIMTSPLGQTWKS